MVASDAFFMSFRCTATIASVMFLVAILPAYLTMKLEHENQEYAKNVADGGVVVFTDPRTDGSLICLNSSLLINIPASQ